VPERIVAASPSLRCSSIWSSSRESEEFRSRLAVSEPGDRPDSVFPPPNRARPLENRELDTWPEASRIPMIVKGSEAEAKPLEMISCTSDWLAFRRDCSSA